jgi:hypothetical protein
MLNIFEKANSYRPPISFIDEPETSQIQASYSSLSTHFVAINKAEHYLIYTT